MDNEILKLLSKELRETKILVLETCRIADAAEKNAEASMKRADAAWELVVITRNQINRPWWKKFFGLQ